ncbi:MAG: adenine phosphoribosyltransferase [Chloroherpetonaceae bacterium]|nr:adenine phosphoribosyltransferase [Chloroherpetonaceae bacterium]
MPVKPKATIKKRPASSSKSDFMKRFEKTLRTVPDFPKPGIQFKDITPILQNPILFKETLEVLAKPYKDKRIDAVVSIESRGFIFGAALAIKLGAGFVPLRKPNKLPYEKYREVYALEYGTDALEIHIDALKKKSRVVLHDDVLATGGTAEAAVKLIQRAGGKIEGLCFLIELGFLGGRARLSHLGIDADLIRSLHKIQ